MHAFVFSHECLCMLHGPMGWILYCFQCTMDQKGFLVWANLPYWMMPCMGCTRHLFSSMMHLDGLCMTDEQITLQVCFSFPVVAPPAPAASSSLSFHLDMPCVGEAALAEGLGGWKASQKHCPLAIPLKETTRERDARFSLNGIDLMCCIMCRVRDEWRPMGAASG